MVGENFSPFYYTRLTIKPFVCWTLTHTYDVGLLVILYELYYININATEIVHKRVCRWELLFSRTNIICTCMLVRSTLSIYIYLTTDIEQLHIPVLFSAHDPTVIRLSRQSQLRDTQTNVQNNSFVYISKFWMSLHDLLTEVVTYIA